MTRLARTIRRRTRTTRATWALSGITIVAVVAACGVAALAGIGIENLTRDPVAVAQVPIYVGMFSNLGVMLWAATAAVALFRYLLFRTQGHATGLRTPSTIRYILSIGLLTTFAALDDMFLFHEQIAPRLFGMVEEAVFVGYIVVVAALAVGFRRNILHSYYGPLIVAAACFAASMALDAVPWLSALFEPVVETVVEDALKLLGIIWWCSYVVQLCLNARRAGPHRSVPSGSRLAESNATIYS